jgi:hypothetical protein
MSADEGRADIQVASPLQPLTALSGHSPGRLVLAVRLPRVERLKLTRPRGLYQSVTPGLAQSRARALEPAAA